MELRADFADMIRGHKSVAAGVITVATAAVAFASSPQWPLALILTLLVLSGSGFAVMVVKRFELQGKAIADCQHEKHQKIHEHNDCITKLHRRDVALAVLTMSNRRKNDNVLLDAILGHEDGKRAREEAKAVLKDLKRT